MWVYAVMLLIVCVSGFLVLRPVVRAEENEGGLREIGEDRADVLQRKKEEVYAAIKEMDFDYGMEKISEDDYEELRSQYKAEAMEIMKKLDGRDREDDVETAIEKEVQHLRLLAGRKVNVESKRGAEREVNYCPKCGMAVEPEDNFCRSCGAGLALSARSG